MKLPSRLHLLSFLLLSFMGCNQAPQQPLRIMGEAQGTYYSISYFDSQNRNLQASIDSLLNAFDLTASLWVDSSLLRRINENRDSIINSDFATLVEYSVAMCKLTEGAFDCTVGKLVSAWGFSFQERQQMSDTLVDSLLQYIGKQPQVLRDSTGRLILHKADPEVTFDFNAIAQGYSTDLIARFLESLGISNYLVDIGGEIFAHGAKADGTPWRIGIERPAANKFSQRKVETSIAVHNKAVVTSGNYRKYYEENGIRYSHTIDPATGRPVKHSLLSVTVVDTAAWRADALATAFMVMGLDRAKNFISNHPNDSGTQAVFFIYDENGRNMTYATNGFTQLTL